MGSPQQSQSLDSCQLRLAGSAEGGYYAVVVDSTMGAVCASRVRSSVTVAQHDARAILNAGGQSVELREGPYGPFYFVITGDTGAVARSRMYASPAERDHAADTVAFWLHDAHRSLR